MAPQPQQGQGGDNSFAIIWIVAAIFITFAVIWYAAQPQIVAFIFKLRLAEISFIKLFTDKLASLESMIHGISPSSYKDVTISILGNISAKVGSYLAYPVGLILLSLAFVTYLNHANLKYRKTYSMQKLVAQEVNDWPQIAPVSKLDLVKQPLDVGPWAMGLTPMQFAKKHDLLIEERTVATPGTFESQPKITAILARGEAYRVFALQLGPYWQGFDKLPMYAKALFAAFAARTAGDRVASAGLLSKVAASTKKDRLDFSGTEALLQKYGNNKHVVGVVSSHAFVLTVMATMLDLARTDGVLPSADFLWLKPIDRHLWLMLNSVGRKTPFAEVAGVFAHWTTERQYGRPIKTPMVNEAVNALELALKEIVYIPDEEEG